MGQAKGWIGVDLDGTLAHYDGWKGELHIGEPIPAMVGFIKDLIAEGHEVRIFTARVAEATDDRARTSTALIRVAIENYTQQHIGTRLAVTNIKDFHMIALYDDRAFHVLSNTGKVFTPDNAMVHAPDTNVAALQRLLGERSVVGLAKYGVTTERTDLKLSDWLQHMIEELLDGAVYARAAKVRVEAMEAELAAAHTRIAELSEHIKATRV